MGSPIVHAEELLAGRRPYVLLDARAGVDARAAYEQAHLPGARFVDVDRDLANVDDPARGGRHPLPAPEAFGETLGRLGVRPMDEVVVYDLASGSNAASRLWWMLRAMGHGRVRVLDGTPESWARAGLAMTREPSRYSPAPPYPASSYSLPMADLETVDARRVDDSFVVIDARAAARFRGEVEPIDPIAGHIPGARNLYHLALVDADGRMLPPANIAAAVHEVAGSKPIESIVVHCGSGVTACHLILAMDYAGLGIPALYVGSWSEWCRTDKPRATGAA